MMRIRQLSKVLLAALVLFMGQAQASLPDYFQPLSIPVLIDILAQAGLETKARSLGSGRQMLPLRLEGRVSVLFLYGCDAADCAEISSIQSLSWVDLDKQASQGESREALLQHINAFNTDYPFGRAYLHPDGRALLEMDISIGQGISAGRVGSFLGGLAGLQEAFEEHMAEFDNARPTVLTPPERVAKPPPVSPPESAADKGGERSLRVRISKATDSDEGCLIRGEVSNLGDGRYEFIGASFLVELSDHYRPMGINAGRGHVTGNELAGPLKPGQTGGQSVTIEGVACKDIQRIVFDDIGYCGSEPPLSAECTAMAAIESGGALELVDRTDRLVGEPVPLVSPRGN